MLGHLLGQLRDAFRVAAQKMHGRVEEKLRHSVRIGVLMTAVKVCQSIEGGEEIVQDGLYNSSAYNSQRSCQWPLLDRALSP